MARKKTARREKRGENANERVIGDDRRAAGQKRRKRTEKQEEHGRKKKATITK